MTLEDVITTWAPLVQRLTAGCSPPITPAVVLAVIYIESKGDAGTINPCGGATGLMQIMPREADPDIFGDRPTQAELLDPETNVVWGIRILKWCLRGNRNLKQGLYFYSGGKAWGSEEDYERKYWRPFQKAYLQVVRALRETKTDDG